jgi:hypothetical protein
VTWWRAARAVAKKDAGDLVREKTLLVAVAVQFFIAAFSAFLLFGLQGLYDPGSLDARVQADVAYVGDGGFDAWLDDQPGIRLFRTDTPDGAMDAIIRETVTADGRHVIAIEVPREDITTALLVTRIQDLLQEYERALRADRADRLDTPALSLPPGGNPAFAFAHATLLPLLVIIPAFLAGSIAGDSFAQELQTRTVTTLRSAPAPVGAIVAGKVAVAVLLAPLQAGLWLLLLAANGFPPASPLMILLAVTAMSSILAAFAVTIAVTIRREGATQAAYAGMALALAVVSQWLPREPLNLLARLSAGPLDAVAVTTVGWLLALGAAAIIAASLLAARVLERGRAS